MADQGYKGFLGPFDANDEFGEMWFVVQQLIKRNATAMLVLVKAVHPATDPLTAPPTIDMQPMVHQINGLDQVEPHGVIYGVPCFRLGRGNCAVIMDPKVGDIGLAIFASHDISTVKATGKVGPPGSRRRFDWADALYFGAFLSGTITRYIQFTDSAINVVDPTAINVTAPTVTVNASTKAVVNSPEVDLGGTGGAAVARVGDTVNLSTGLITSGSSKVKAT